MARSSSAAAGLPGSAGVFSMPATREVARVGLWSYLIWLAQACVWLFLAGALWSFSAADWPSHAVYPHQTPIGNWCGLAGAWVSYQLFALMGWGAWLLLVLWALHLAVSGFVTRVSHLSVRFVGGVIMAAAFAGVQAVLMPASGPLPDLAGGLIGQTSGGWLTERFSTFGSMVWLLLSFLVGAVVAVDIWVVLAPMWAFKQVKAATPPVAAAAATAAGHTAVATKKGWGFLSAFWGAGATEAAPTRKLRMPKGLDRPAKGKKGEAAEVIDDTAGGLGATEAFNPDDHIVGGGPEGDDEGDGVGEVKIVKKSAKKKPAAEDDADEALDATPEAEAEDDANEGEGAEETGSPKTFDPEELRAKMAKLPLRFAGAAKQTATEADLRDIQNVAELPGYKFPGVDLLEEPDQSYPEKLEQFVREQATNLERALREYNINGEVVGIDSGPVITFYEIRLAAGTKVSALSAISSDLARALKSVSIRIVSNTEGRDTVGIEVPNPHKEKVRLKELMSQAADWGKMNLPMFLGKDASGNPLIVDLTSMPHMLIAGTTGSGKSVCMSSILMSFLYTKKPNELKLVLVDPKMVELSQFKDVPHLMCPVVTEMSKAAAILEWAVRKMDERYELLVEAGCRDITGYNSLTWEELKERFSPKDENEEARIPKKLPYMVFVIDELADLMMTNKEVESSIIRIAQKARAVGIHLIVATQRPQANVVTGLIKANMPARICFKVASGMDSRIVMDQKGGELLLGQGDMLYLSPKSAKLTRSQGTLVDDKEIRRVVKFLKDIAQPSFEHSLMQIKTGSAAGPLGSDDEDGSLEGVNVAQSDPLFDRAVEAVIASKSGSVSLLQRRFAIGYTRASKLIEAMGHAGILGPHVGTQAREVMVTPEEWQAMKAQAEEDAKNPKGPPPGAKQSVLFPEPVPDLSAQPGDSLDDPEDAPFDDDQADTDDDDDDDDRR